MGCWHLMGRVCRPSLSIFSHSNRWVNARYGGEDAISILCAIGPFLCCGICILNQSLIGNAAAAVVEDQENCVKLKFIHMAV